MPTQRKSKEEIEFLKLLELALDAAPSLTEITKGLKFENKQIEELLSTFSPWMETIEITPNFKIKNCKEIIDRAIRNYKKSFTGFDDFGMPQHLDGNRPCRYRVIK